MTMKMKNILCAVLCALTLCSVTACSATIKASSTETAAAVAAAAENPAETSAIVGGWELMGETLEDNAEALAAFNLATQELMGVSYEPLALLGTQVVAGTNYCILCRSTPVYPDAEATLSLVYVYADLEGNAEVTDVQDLEVGTAETEENVQIANPFREVTTLAEAAEIVGFDMTVPAAPASHPDTVIRVLEEHKLVEVLYVNAANETEDSLDELYRIRKASGSEDISGDYNDYDQESVQEIGGASVTLRGDGEAWSVAVWTQDGYSYAVDAQDHPLSLEEMTAIVSAVK